MRTIALVLVCLVSTCHLYRIRLTRGIRHHSSEKHQDTEIRPQHSQGQAAAPLIFATHSGVAGDLADALATLFLASTPATGWQSPKLAARRLGAGASALRFQRRSRPPLTMSSEAGFSPFVGEACRMFEAQRSLAETVAVIRDRADQDTPTREMKLSTVDYMGADDAPPGVRKQFEDTSSGARPYAYNEKVAEVWDAMDTAEDFNGPLPFGAWSPWALRALGAGSAIALDGIQSSGDREAVQFAVEVVERWSAFAKALAESKFGGSTPAFDQVLQEDSSGRRIEAYVTHMTNDDYVLGAAVLAASLAATKTARPLVALVTDGVSATGRKTLHDAGWALLDVSLVGSAEEDPEFIRGYFSKIWLWGLPCHSVIYLDTDIVVMENLDELFEIAQGRELAAVPDSLPHVHGDLEVQAGLMVVEPSPARFADLWEICCGSRRKESLEVWKHHEQGFLALYFDGDRGVEACGPGDPRPQWQNLPAKYNFNIRYQLRPLYEGLRPANTAIIHYACCKPWDLKQRDYAPPNYVELFLDLARAINVPWRPGTCEMDQERLKHQRQKFQDFMMKEGRI